MEEINLGNRVYAYAIYALSVVVFLLSLVSLNPYLLAFTTVVIFASVVYMHSASMINTILMKRFGLPYAHAGYSLSDDGRSVTKKDAGVYTATCAAMLNVKKNTDTRGIGNVIGSIRVPFEFKVALEPVETKGIVEGLETRRRIKEIELSRLDSKDYTKANAIKRGIEAIEEELNAIKGGGKPIQMVITVKTSASSASLADAEIKAHEQIDSLASAFSTMNLAFEVLSGEKLLNAM